MKENKSKKDLSKLFNFNNILSQVINFAAYIISFISVIILLYISFVDKFNVQIDWTTLGIFTAAVVMLAWLNWTTWYKRQYERVMSDDIIKHSQNKYSVHGRYYFNIRGWTDIQLQTKIDKFNKEYEENWLRWVEHETGVPIESRYEVQIENGKPVLDENGQVKKILVKGIKDLPYRKFKHKILMWRVKNHRYPKTGYKTAMEVMSLFSYQEANLSKRHLKADKSYYAKRSITKFLSLLLTVSIGGSLIPEFMNGNKWSAILKLLIALGSLLSSILMGAMNGIRGARIKLCTVEEVCFDLEKWADKKPIIEPYEEIVVQPREEQIVMNLEEKPLVTKDIFNTSNLPK